MPRAVAVSSDGTIPRKLVENLMTTFAEMKHASDLLVYGAALLESEPPSNGLTDATNQ